MARPSYRSECPGCGHYYLEDAYIESDDPDRLCPLCLIADTGQFNPEWFVNNPCPYPIGTEERRQVMMARVQFLLPTKIDGDNEDYDRKTCKGIVSRSRSTRNEWLKRQPKTGTISHTEDYDYGD